VALILVDLLLSLVHQNMEVLPQSSQNTQNKNAFFSSVMSVTSVARIRLPAAPLMQLAELLGKGF
jgi:hypothetical protein